MEERQKCRKTKVKEIGQRAGGKEMMTMSKFMYSQLTNFKWSNFLFLSFWHLLKYLIELQFSCWACYNSKLWLMWLTTTTSMSSFWKHEALSWHFLTEINLYKCQLVFADIAQQEQCYRYCSWVLISTKGGEKSKYSWNKLTVPIVMSFN